MGRGALLIKLLRTTLQEPCSKDFRHEQNGTPAKLRVHHIYTARRAEPTTPELLLHPRLSKMGDIDSMVDESPFVFVW